MPIADSIRTQSEVPAGSRKRTELSPAYHGAIKFAVVLQIALGASSYLVLDMGQSFRAFCVAWLCQWTVTLIIVLRRRLTPTRLDLFAIRYGILALWVAMLVVGPWFLRVMGTAPELIP